jgi:hypothetical protein
VRGVVYTGKGWPKGTGKEAILAEVEADPDASPKEIAERAGVSERYAQKIIKELDEARKEKAKKR